MNIISFTRFATASVAAGVTSIVLCAPANAMQVPAPGAAPSSTSGSTTRPPVSSGTEWDQLALGAGGGVALVGMGAAAALAGKRRRTSHTAHPA